MKKFDSIEDLAKAAGHLASGFSKNASFHKAAAGHHAAQMTHHGEMAAFHKGVHDALEDGHEQKSFHKRMHEHHEVKKAHHSAMHELHKGYGEDAEKAQKAIADAFGLEGTEPKPVTKADGSEPTPAAGGIEGMITATTQGLVKKSLEMLDNDEAIANAIRQSVLAQVQKALSGQIVPDGVHAIPPSNPPDAVLQHLKLVPRGGSPGLEKAAIDPGMEEALAI